MIFDIFSDIFYDIFYDMICGIMLPRVRRPVIRISFTGRRPCFFYALNSLSVHNSHCARTV